MVNLDSLRDTFSNKKVFITGHTGFKGSWLSFLLAEVGARVAGFSLPPATEPNHFSLLNLQKKIDSTLGDIRNFSQLNNCVQKFEPEFVFHMAAQALVRPSYKDPCSTVSTNVLGSMNLLESIRHCESVRSLVYVTSDKCYENVEWVWGYRENDPLGGRDPYSASKAAAEIIFSSFSHSFFNHLPRLGAASVRAGNVIGGGDWSLDRIIPDCISAVEDGRPILLRNPGATRPWQHVLEPLSGYLELAQKLYDSPKDWGGPWNFGPSTDEVRTVVEVAQSVVRHFGRGEIKIVDGDNKVHEAGLLQLNCDKAHQLLGWHPRWHVDRTLEETASWYKKVLCGGSAEAITRHQINEYFSS